MTVLFTVILLAWAFVTPIAAQSNNCEVIDFNEFNHGESINTVSLFGDTVTLTFSAIRDPGVAVNATGYDTELWDLDGGTSLPEPPNSTHNDTQRFIACNPAENGNQGECTGVMMVIPDENFPSGGDDTQGGTITITGFTGSFEIPTFAGVDSDDFGKRIILRVGNGLTFVGETTGLGDGTVETVQTEDHLFSDQAEFEFLGSGGIDNIEICLAGPGIDIEKATNGVDADDANAGDAPQVGPGDPVNWTYVVTNTGAVPLVNVVVTDDQGVTVNCPQDTLAVGESMNCRANGFAEDLENTGFTTVPGLCGSVPNTPLYENMGHATGESETGDFVEDTDPSHYCNPPEPAIDIEKATNGVDADDPDAGDAPQVGPGDPVEWTYKVTNIGPVPLVNVVVTDDQGVTVLCPQDTLAVGEMMICFANGFAEDLENTGFTTVPGTCGSIPERPLYENMGHVTGESESGDFVEDIDPSHYCNPEEPAIDIEKATNGVDADNPNAGDAPQVAAGNNVEWSYVVTNTGTVKLLNVQAFDETLGVALDCPKDMLDPGESMTCNPISAPADDLQFGDPDVVPGTCGGIPNRPLYENIARVTGESEEGTFVEDDDPSHYCNEDVPECGLTVEKTCEIPTPPPSGDKCDGKLQQFTVIWTAGNITIGGPPNDTANGAVSNGQEVTFFGPFDSNDVFVDIDGDPAGDYSKFHVSCSDDNMNTPDDCGKLQGNGKGTDGVNKWTLEGWVDNNGSVLDCTDGSGPGGQTDCVFQSAAADCTTFPDKPNTLTFRVAGGGCAASDNDQSPDKVECDSTGTPLPANPGVAVMVSVNGETPFPVAPAETFTIERAGDPVLELMYGGGTEYNKFHGSCSQPLQAGDHYGSFELIALDGVGLGTTVIYTYVVGNDGAATITNITVTDNKLGPVLGSPIASLDPGDTETLTATAFIDTTTTNVVEANGTGFPGECLAADFATVTVLPPLPCDVTITLKELKDDRIKYTLTNSTASKATLETLMLTWPVQHGNLKKIKLDGDIFTEELPPPSAAIFSDDWINNVSKRQLDPGESRTLEIEFKNDYSANVPGDFTIALTFEEGCSATPGPGDGDDETSDVWEGPASVNTGSGPVNELGPSEGNPTSGPNDPHAETPDEDAERDSTKPQRRGRIGRRGL